MEQEYKDATKLGSWKRALKGSKNSKCSDEVRDYLDIHLPGWRGADNKSETMSSIPETESMQESIEEEPLEIIPKKKKSTKLTKPKKMDATESPDQKRQRVKTEISELHKRYKSLRSENLHQEFNQEPQKWYRYHSIAEENEKSFPEEEIPRNRIIQKLNEIKIKRTKKVVDMGCGKAQISNYFKDDPRFHFMNYDHISCNDSVTMCDISRLPLEDDSVEICILSLAMWGSNCEEYIQEAYRVLESGGKLYIIEPTKRWSEKDEQDNIIEGKEATKLTNLLEKNNFQIVERSIEKFCLFVCIKS